MDIVTDRSAFRRLLRGLAPRESARVRSVWDFARVHLREIKRRSGDSYVHHGLEVALVLREASVDPSLLCIALLHDAPLHPSGAAILLRSPLTAEERALSERMHQLRRMHIDEDTKDLDAFLRAFAEDERLFILRMAHRVNDVRHLRRFVPSLRRRIAHETLHMYTAIAGRIGMHTWRTEMEDLCFALLHPRIARSLKRKYDAFLPLDDACLRHTSAFLRRALQKSGIACALSLRKKGLYSTFRKMTLKRRHFEELTDRLAVRIIVNNRDECYRALGVVHGSMHPIPGKLKDYIGAPKENGYQSIHTVIYPLPGVTEQPMEIQIRTHAMHGACEFGSAAHGEYKNLLYTLESGEARVHLLHNLESLREEVRSPAQFGAALRRYYRDDHIPVFESEGGLFHLRSPATALDFICHAFPDRCAFLTLVRINGRVRPAGTSLHAGDTVEPHFGTQRTVHMSWRGECRHARSRMILGKLLRE